MVCGNDVRVYRNGFCEHKPAERIRMNVSRQRPYTNGTPVMRIARQPSAAVVVDPLTPAIGAHAWVRHPGLVASRTRECSFASLNVCIRAGSAIRPRQVSDCSEIVSRISRRIANGVPTGIFVAFDWKRPAWAAIVRAGFRAAGNFTRPNREKRLEKIK